jgi:predicted nuclease with TOPRIM domain
MRRRVVTWMMTLVLAMAGMTWAQDQSNPEELNRKYQEALTQLKAAQDRKNELATENEQLTARIHTLEKQLEDAKRESATIAEQTYQLRAQYSAWEVFLRRYPRLLSQWKQFILRNPLSRPTGMPEIDDPVSPLSAE